MVNMQQILKCSSGDAWNLRWKGSKIDAIELKNASLQASLITLTVHVSGNIFAFDMNVLMYPTTSEALLKLKHLPILHRKTRWKLLTLIKSYKIKIFSWVVLEQFVKWSQSNFDFPLGCFMTSLQYTIEHIKPIWTKKEHGCLGLFILILNYSRRDHLTFRPSINTSRRLENFISFDTFRTFSKVSWQVMFLIRDDDKQQEENLSSNLFLNVINGQFGFFFRNFTNNLIKIDDKLSRIVQYLQ